MGYLVAIAVSLLLLAAFLALTRYELTHGVRFFASSRARLDRNVDRLELIVTHVDLAAFLRTETREFMRRAGHDVTHLVLQVVRAVERLLTRLVRHLRMHEQGSATPTREASRDFVKKLTDFKGELSSSRKKEDEVR